MTSRPTRILTLNKLACLTIMAVVLAAGSLAYQYRYLRPSDDYFFLMFVSGNFLAPEESNRLYQRYDAHLKDLGYGSEPLVRADVRQSMDENYLTQGLFFVPFVLLVRDSALSVEQKTVIVMFGGFLTMYLAISLVLLLALWRCRDPNIVVSVVLAALFIYFVDFTARPSVHRHLHPGVLGVGWVEQAQHLFNRLVHPGPKYVIYNFAPKDRLTVLVTALLIVRWGGGIRLAYLLLPLLFLVHIEYTGLLLAMFVAIDLTVRPRMVLTSWVAPWAGLLLGIFIMISALGQRVEVTGWIAAVPVILALAGMAVFRLADKSAPRGLRAPFERYGDLVGRWSPPLQDMAAFGAIWVALLPVTYVLYRLSGGEGPGDTHLDNTLWLLVPTRYLGLFAFAVVILVFWSLLRLGRIQVTWGTTWPGAAVRTRIAAFGVAAMLALAPAGAFALRQGAAPWTVALEKVRVVERSFDTPIAPATWHRDEVKVYYAMFTTLVTDADRLGRLGVP